MVLNYQCDFTFNVQVQKSLVSKEQFINTMGVYSNFDPSIFSYALRF